jgi:hypothetical protein
MGVHSLLKLVPVTGNVHDLISLHLHVHESDPGILQIMFQPASGALGKST